MKNNDALDAYRQEFEDWYRTHYGLSRDEQINGHSDFIVWRAAWNTRPQPSGDAVEPIPVLKVATLLDDNKRLAEALQMMATQKLEHEWDTDRMEWDEGDFEGAYIEFVTLAREALAQRIGGNNDNR